MSSSAVRARLVELAARYTLPSAAPDRLARLLELVAAEPAAITSVRDPQQGVDVHIADSLVALEVPAVRTARSIADLGSGGGFPGLVLAVALPAARVALVESVRRKCAFLARAVGELGLDEAVDVVCARAEAWPAGLEAFDVVTARAVAPLGVILELAAPLLHQDGTLVAWKGRRDPAEEQEALVAADALALSAPDALPVAPFDGAGERHLYLSLKVGSTPNRYPRRPGMARKRPIGGSGRR